MTTTARRGFLASVLGCLGVGAASAMPTLPKINTEKLKGFLVFTINVHGLAPFKAEALCDRLRDRLVKERNDPGWRIIIIPVRGQDTKFEVIAINDDETAGKVEARRLKAFEMLNETFEEEKETQEYPDIKNVKENILISLGAPVVKVELDDAQLELCYNKAVEEVDESPYIVTNSIFHGIALAHAKMILGRIRSKYYIDGNVNIVDGPSLLAEGERELYNCRQQIRD